MPANIVLVEDERIVALNLQRRLTRLGYNVPGLAVSGNDALALVAQHKPDLVLMDIHIEGDIDGIDTGQLVRERFQTPVIYLTAYSEESTLARAKKTCPYGYLLKPFSERELHATIQMSLERHQMEQALRRSEARLRTAMNAADMADWELVHDQWGNINIYSGRADQLLGHRCPIFMDDMDAFIQLIHPEDKESVKQSLLFSVEQKSDCHAEFRNTANEADMQWLLLQGKAHESPDGTFSVIGVIQNITERKRAEFQQAEAAAVIEATQDAIIIVNDKLELLSSNTNYTVMTGYDEHESQGKVPDFISAGAMRSSTYQQLSNALKNQSEWRGEINVKTRSQEVVPVLASISAPMKDHANQRYYIIVLTDLSIVHSMKKQLEYLAHYDPLTGLPNRLLIRERLEQAIVQANRHKERVAVLFIDLDHFKWVNDSLGHENGDAYLKLFANKLKANLRDADSIGRIGGDEFLVVINPVGGESAAFTVVHKLLQNVSGPVTVGGRTLELSCSIGVCFYPDDALTFESLVQAADTAMYSAKNKGRNNFVFFKEEMMAKAVQQMNMNQEMQSAIKQKEFCLHYQPQIDISTRKIIGVEALIRWQHPEKGLIYPNEFIPAAEENGMIIDIGEWVMHEACEQLHAWNKSFKSPITMAINVSPMQLCDAKFIDNVEKAISLSGVDPCYLEFEVTESLLQNEQLSLKNLMRLKNLGIQISIDDFGTGYSNLSSLKSLPINKLKIDKSFMDDVPGNAGNKAVAELIISMGHRLGMLVIAEGVETEEQLAFLRKCGCDQMQGYLFFKPLSLS